MALRANARRVGTALFVLIAVAGLTIGASGCLGGSGDAEREQGAAKPKTVTRSIAPCTWSYFGDPRAVANPLETFTGCVTTEGNIRVEAYDAATDRRRLLTLFRGLEVDDHNNPSLIFFKRKLYAFVSEHAGYVFPRDRASRMQYRVSSNEWAAGRSWESSQTIPLEPGCGLGYTYPSPINAGGRMYLFMRGPCWAPYYTSTSDGKNWDPPRTLLANSHNTEDGRKIRPYSKYQSTKDGSILMTFSDGHPGSHDNSLYFMRFKDDSFFRADGTRIGGVENLPFTFDQLDVVQATSDGKGNPWPMDVALDDGVPVIVYSNRVGKGDDFRYARYSRTRGWLTRKIVAAGTKDLFKYRNGGITFNQADPKWVVLTRVIDGEHEIELRYTPDRGRTWQTTQLTRNSKAPNFRPFFPRGVKNDERFTVVYVSGKAKSFRKYRTEVKMKIFTPPKTTKP